MERPAGTVARFFSTSPPCCRNMQVRQDLDSSARAASRCPSAIRWSARGRALSRAQAWNAANERRLVDQPGLQGKQPKQEMAIGSHWDPPMNLGRGSTPRTSERRPVDGRMNVSSVR